MKKNMSLLQVNRLKPKRRNRRKLQMKKTLLHLHLRPTKSLKRLKRWLLKKQLSQQRRQRSKMRRRKLRQLHLKS